MRMPLNENAALTAGYEGGALAHLLRWASIYSFNALLNLPFQPLYYFLELQLFPLSRRERLGSKYAVDLA